MGDPKIPGHFGDRASTLNQGDGLLLKLAVIPTRALAAVGLHRVVSFLFRKTPDRKIEETSERVVVALGDHGGVCPASSPSGQRRARTDASGIESRCGHSARTQRSGAEATHWSLDQLLQSSASS